LVVVVVLLVEVKQLKSIFGYIVFALLVYVVLLCLFADIAVQSAVSSTNNDSKNEKVPLGAKTINRQALVAIRITLILHILIGTVRE
jgi:uncharacterized membrane protein